MIGLRRICFFGWFLATGRASELIDSFGILLRKANTNEVVPAVAPTITPHHGKRADELAAVQTLVIDIF